MTFNIQIFITAHDLHNFFHRKFLLIFWLRIHQAEIPVLNVKSVVVQNYDLKVAKFGKNFGQIIDTGNSRFRLTIQNCVLKFLNFSFGVKKVV